MDINFHYFAVKTIAFEAGFSKGEAQLIASYSQFVDDYNVWQNYRFRTVPDYAKSLRSKDKDIFGFWGFYTVTTGFDKIEDMIRLESEKYQREITVPFHFIPFNKLSELSGKREEFRTVRADITGSSLVANLLRSAMQRCIDSKGSQEYHFDLIRLGVLLHVFADTYAHEGFSGFHGWENYCYITGIESSETSKPVKDDMSPDIYGELYALGHAEAGHAPDMTYAVFHYNYAANAKENSKSKYSNKKSRNNTNQFLDAAEQIFNVMYRICHNNEVPTETQWDTLKAKLLIGFRTEGTNFTKLKKAWRVATGNTLTFSYDKDDLWKKQLVPVLLKENEIPDAIEENGLIEDLQFDPGIYKTASDDFFHFNLIAKEIRDAVIG